MRIDSALRTDLPPPSTFNLPPLVVKPAKQDLIVESFIGVTEVKEFTMQFCSKVVFTILTNPWQASVLVGLPRMYHVQLVF